MSKKPINIEFREPTIADAEWASPLLSTGMKICEFSFTTIWMWRSIITQIARYGDTVFIRSATSSPIICLPWART